MNRKQVYVLDYSTWRSGDISVNKVGEGDTNLLNKDGYSCCLGQFAQQKGVRRHKLLGLVEPCGLAYHLSKVYDKNFCASINNVFSNTDLGDELIHINDSSLNPALKLFTIRRHLHKVGCRLVIKNMPHDVSRELVQLYKKFHKRKGTRL